MNNIRVIKPGKDYFYTAEETDFIREGIKSRMRAKAIAKLFVQKFGRNEVTVINRVAFEKKKLGLSRSRNVTKQPKQPATIKLPEGFTFSGTAKRVEISSDYFKVYF